MLEMRNMNETGATKRALWSRRAGRALGVLVATTLLGACGDLLDVDNPGAIVEGDLKDPAMIPMIVNGVIGEFQPGFTNYALYAGTLSDELNDVHSWRENSPIDLRATDDNNGLISGSIYVPLQRARSAGDEGAKLLRELLGEKGGQSLDVARVLAYSGYSLVLLGEGFCSAPIDVSVAHPPAKLFDMAIERFDEAIAVAGAAKQAGAKAASADSLINLARVGAARAALGQDARAKALQYAKDVPAGFLYWVTHSSNSTRQYNPFWEATRKAATEPHIALDPTFEGLNDRRVVHPAQKDTLMTLSRTGFVPLIPSSFQGWDPQNPKAITQATAVRLASGLEARYIVAETGGMSDAELFGFINERRAVGGQVALASAAGVDLKGELRDQRRRDFFIDGHRLGDLRRYKATGVGDFFSKGEWPYSTTTPKQQYGTMECFDIPLAEKNSNPNLKK
jgi:hypothetical protein